MLGRDVTKDGFLGNMDERSARAGGGIAREGRGGGPPINKILGGNTGLAAVYLKVEVGDLDPVAVLGPEGKAGHA